MQSKQRIKAKGVLKWILYISLITLGGFVVAVISYALGDERTGPLFLTETQFIEHLSGEYCFDLGPIEKDYVLCYQQFIRGGRADVWIENEKGEAMSTRKNLCDYWMIAKEAGIYRLRIDAEDATIDLTISLYYPCEDTRDKQH